MLPPHLIFDLGAVLYAIDFQATIDAFNALMGGQAHDQILAAVQHHEGWKALERGQLSEGEFRTVVREEFELDASDAQIDQAWNALLLGPIPGRVEVLEALAQDHDLVLLSNTNSIHFRHLLPQSQALLAPFQRLFLSYEMGFRKPELEIYELVLTEMGWNGEDCLFLDDSQANVEAARTIGLKACQVEGEGPALTEVLTQF